MRLWMLCICAFSLIFQLRSTEAIIENSTIEMMSGGPQLQELIFRVSPRDLNLSEDGISITVGGVVYAVHSLKRQRDVWVAKASPHGNCSWGHPLCAYCGLCHIKICPLYQKRCSKSE